jgi:hypothetical protein
MLEQGIVGTAHPHYFNQYDIREKCEYPPLCYNMTAADGLLGRDDVKRVLGVEGRDWTDCDMAVH